MLKKIRSHPNLFIKTGTPPNCDVPEEFKDMSKGCFDEMRRQIQTEIDASMQYLAMGAHFARDVINRPGFSEFFFKSAAEEREHSHKLIEYLLMRGNLTDGLSTLISVNVIYCCCLFRIFL